MLTRLPVVLRGRAVVNMVTKSGTNVYHGAGYDYLVNEALNTAQPYTGIKNKLRQNDYGFTFGGPLRIPKVYNGTNRTFFFFSFEQFRQKLINDTFPMGSLRRMKARSARSGASAYLWRTPTSAAISELRNDTV